MARQEKKYHYIYKITCNVTNRYYIGMHSTDNLNDGYFGSGKRLWFSINYHGKENHSKQILEFLESRELLKEREKELVTKELISEDLCMNLVIGGEGGGFVNDEHFKKFQLAGSKAGNESFKEKLKDEDFKSFFSDLKREHGINRYNNGTLELITKRCDWSGRTHSEESKEKTSKTMKGKGSGETNSQFGTCWMVKDGIVKKVKKDELETHLRDGWKTGRR